MHCSDAFLEIDFIFLNDRADETPRVAFTSD